jgi:hypothetical protein
VQREKGEGGWVRLRSPCKERDAPRPDEGCGCPAMQRAAGGSVEQRGWVSSAASAGWVEGPEVGLRFRGRGWGWVVAMDFVAGVLWLSDFASAGMTGWIGRDFVISRDVSTTWIRCCSL